MMRNTPEEWAEKEKTVLEYLNDPRTTGGRDRLYGHLRTNGENISRREVAQVLADDVVTQIHKPLNKRSTMKQIIVRGPAVQAQVDLVDMQKLSGFNKGVRYLLTYVDIFSKYCQVRTLKNKTAIAVTDAMKDILEDMPAKYRPRTIQADNGSEFQTVFEAALQKRGIKTIHSLAYSPSTQGSIERFNRTIKSAIFTLMDRQKTKDYIQFLNPLIDNFNSTKHGTTGYTPMELMTHMPLHEDLIKEIQSRMRTKIKHTVQSDYMYEVGDLVRVALTTDAAVRRDKFRKRIKANWSSDVFEIYSISTPVTAGTQPQYLLKNLTTNRKSIRRYWNFQLEPSSMPESDSDSELDEDVPATERVIAPVIPARSKTTRVRAPSAAAMENIIASSYW